MEFHLPSFVLCGGVTSIPEITPAVAAWLKAHHFTSVRDSTSD
jgi:hypothetical protein